MTIQATALKRLSAAQDAIKARKSAFKTVLGEALHHCHGYTEVKAVVATAKKMGWER